MKTIKDVIAKLNKVDFNEVDGKKLIGTALGNKVEVTYSTKLNQFTNKLALFPVQIIVQIRINDIHAKTWGCIDNEENHTFATWFTLTKSQTYHNEFDKERKEQKEADAILKAL